MGNINESEVKQWDDGSKEYVHCDRCDSYVVLDEEEMIGWCMRCGEEIIIVFEEKQNETQID